MNDRVRGGSGASSRAAPALGGAHDARPGELLQNARAKRYPSSRLHVTQKSHADFSSKRTPERAVRMFLHELRPGLACAFGVLASLQDGSRDKNKDWGSASRLCQMMFGPCDFRTGRTSRHPH